MSKKVDKKIIFQKLVKNFHYINFLDTLYKKRKKKDKLKIIFCIVFLYIDFYFEVMFYRLISMFDILE